MYTGWVVTVYTGYDCIGRRYTASILGHFHSPSSRCKGSSPFRFPPSRSLATSVNSCLCRRGHTGPNNSCTTLGLWCQNYGVYPLPYMPIYLQKRPYIPVYWGTCLLPPNARAIPPHGFFPSQPRPPVCTLPGLWRRGHIAPAASYPHFGLTPKLPCAPQPCRIYRPANKKQPKKNVKLTFGGR